MNLELDSLQLDSAVPIPMPDQPPAEDRPPTDDEQVAAYLASDPHSTDPWSGQRNLDLVRYILQTLHARVKTLESRTVAVRL